MINKIFYGWWIVFACALLGLYVGGIVFFGFTAFFEPIRDEFGWSYAQISFAVSLRGMEMGIFAPVAGFLVDRFGPRKLILSGTITVGFGLILLSRTHSLLVFYASFMLVAFGAGGCTAVVTMTAVAKWFRRKIGLALGFMGAGIGAGGTVVLLIVHLIDLYQWRTTLIILGLGAFVLGIPLSFIIRDRPENYGYLPDGEQSRPTTPGEVLEIQDQSVEISLKEALKKRSFLYLNVSEFIRLMVITTVIVHVMPYLTSMGLTRSTGGMVAGAIPLLGMIGRFGFGWLGDFMDKRLVLTMTFGLLILGMLAFGSVHMRWAIVLFLVFFPLGHGGSMVSRATLVREFFGRESFGKMIGIILGCGAVGGIVGPTLAGWTFDVLGNYRPVWFIFAGLCGLAMVLIMRIK